MTVYAVRGRGASRNYVRVSHCEEVLWLTRWESFTGYDSFRTVGWRSMVGERVCLTGWIMATGIHLEEGEYTTLTEGGA